MLKGSGPEFGDFQRDLDRALGGDTGGLEAWWTHAKAGAAGLSVYRNTGAKGAVEALMANYPTVERVVGEAWLRGAALRFSRVQPPTRPALYDYGAGFADWLERFGGVAGPDYLPDLARLDRLWTEAHFAEDAAPLPLEAFALPPGAIARAVATPHPSARWAAFAWNAPELWRLNRPPPHEIEAMTLDLTPAGVLIVRPEHEVLSRPIEVAGCVFLDACAAGRTLGQATEATLDAEPKADIPLLVSTLIEAGAFVSLEVGL